MLMFCVVVFAYQWQIPAQKRGHEEMQLKELAALETMFFFQSLSHFVSRLFRCDTFRNHFVCSHDLILPVSVSGTYSIKKCCYI